MENSEGISLGYNTGREKMRMPEYGRNVLNMIEQVKSIPDRQKRTEQAAATVKVMEILNPAVRSQDNYEQKLWDHLYMIAGFDLDIDSPYPCPVREDFETRPVPLPMKGTKIKATHYGRNIEKMIDLLCEQEEGESKTAMFRSLAIYMRQQYLIWNKDSVSDETIFNDLVKLSGNRLTVPEGLELGKVSSDLSYNKPGTGTGAGHGRNQKGNRKNFRQNKRR